MTDPGWVCAQQGAREHYAIPRALAAAGRLRCFITDAWKPRESLLSELPIGIIRRLAARHHPDIPSELIRAHTLRFSVGDAIQKLRRQRDAAFHSGRNAAFDRLAARDLEHHLRTGSGPPPVVFAYAHACRDLFRVARAAGCPTLLGQFDPGPREADIVDAESRNEPSYRTRWERYPPEYVARWRDEIGLSDAVLVNSEWSAECLRESGVPADVIRIAPLVFTPGAPVEPRRYPQAFSRERPFTLLFLGQVILRKGIARLIRAAEQLRDEPISIRLVGPTDIFNLEDRIRGLPISWSGPVARNRVDRHYAEADAFILPTLSDGFALTQLEAKSWRLPVIASRRCGTVVRDGVDGFVLPEPTVVEIVGVMRRCLAEPALLERMSAESTTAVFSLDGLASELGSLFRDHR